MLGVVVLFELKAYAAVRAGDYAVVAAIAIVVIAAVTIVIFAIVVAAVSIDVVTAAFAVAVNLVLKNFKVLVDFLNILF